ncbi:MAG: NAD-dependent epimerase/dehydratase family protein [Planctomycetota bacterium]|jgi:dihydroflavonol-4-reductase
MTLTLVTGGTGFIGRHLVAALTAAGGSVRVLARPSSEVGGLDGVELLRGDLTSQPDLERALDGVSRVFHMAAETRDGQPAARYRAVNSDAVETLLELAHARGVERFVHTSSYFAIGRTGPPRMPEDHVADEYWTHDPGDMHNAHEESKYDAEHAVNQRVSVSEPVLALIPTMVYGPERRPVARPEDLSPGNRIVRMLAEHAAGRLGPMPGDGRQLWNLVHVEDVVAGHLAAMEGASPEGTWPPPAWGHWHYILGGENVRVADLFQRFAKLSGVAPPQPARSGGFLGKLFGGKPAGGRAAMDAHNWAYTSAMAEQDFGYHGRSLDEGLAPTVEWMRECGWIGPVGSSGAPGASKG